MKILITGIHGFVGSNLVERFKSNHDIYGLDIAAPEKEGVLKTYGWEDLNIIPKVDAIIHLAGMAHDTKDQTKSEVYFDVNTGLTKKIYDWFLESDAQSFIFFSSVKAAADSVKTNILTEDIIPEPIGPYGQSKIKAEEYILSKADKSYKKEKRYYILRPCMIHGPGNKGNLNLLYNIVRKGIPWPLGTFENKRSFCAVDNITYVVEQIIVRNNIPVGIYHVCDDEALSTNNLIKLMSESVNKKPHIWKIPQKLINIMATLGTQLHLPLTKERLQKLTENYIVSNQKIKKALAISDMPISAKEGLIRTFKSFK